MSPWIKRRKPNTLYSIRSRRNIKSWYRSSPTRKTTRSNSVTRKGRPQAKSPKWQPTRTRSSSKSSLTVSKYSRCCKFRSKSKTTTRAKTSWRKNAQLGRLIRRSRLKQRKRRMMKETTTKRTRTRGMRIQRMKTTKSRPFPCSLFSKIFSLTRSRSSSRRTRSYPSTRALWKRWRQSWKSRSKTPSSNKSRKLCQSEATWSRRTAIQSRISNLRLSPPRESSKSLTESSSTKKTTMTSDRWQMP